MYYFAVMLIFLCLSFRDIKCSDNRISFVLLSVLHEYYRDIKRTLFPFENEKMTSQ
ncbi:uncharacterized protein BX663DRAFT_493799 [Cokeromyces recurvatus]|uniref:uncharacterized protein n=1 Tax=Cokeromyces recurvatus TaxID=90255 RepID=UPI00222053EC|nr:uncharacterized protein BX663DRAFT_493799 [Cokeromyces recurvatus]KAI7908322.1 hypothetical protein BX663DRAFT_493799 [Cokeromyces recurvatus]